MKRILGGAAALAVTAAAVTAFLNHRALDRLDRRFTSDAPTGADRRALAEARRVKAAHGSSVWPGFGEADLPQVLYNDAWEFLAGWPPPPPSGWRRAGEAELFGVPVWRRRAGDPRPFAVRIADRWTGRYPVRRVLNRRRVREARAGMDPLSALLVPVRLSTAPTDLYVVQLLHTVFHAFQAERSEDRFYEAVELRGRVAGRYPFDASPPSELWTEEGRALDRARTAEGRGAACRAVEDFRSARTRRRRSTAFDATTTAYERGQEWLQGLAKFAELRLYRRAARESGSPEGVEYRSGPAHWEDDLEDLRSGLGSLGRDRRFAVSGLGQALALERLDPDWKARALPGGRPLDELLAETCADQDAGSGREARSAVRDWRR